MQDNSKSNFNKYILKPRTNGHSEKPSKQVLMRDTAKKICAHHYQQFNDAAEGAFLNIQWVNTELKPIEKQVVTLQFDTNTILILIVSIREIQKHDISVYVWQVSAYMVNKKRVGLVRQNEWTRKQKHAIISYAQAMVYAVNSTFNASYTIEGNVYKGIVGCTSDDLLVIEAAKLDLQNDKITEKIHQIVEIENKKKIDNAG